MDGGGLDVIHQTSPIPLVYLQVVDGGGLDVLPEVPLLAGGLTMRVALDSSLHEESNMVVCAFVKEQQGYRRRKEKRKSYLY